MKRMVAVLMVLVIMSPVVSLAWQENGVVICDDPSSQSNPRIASDDLYGAIITWVDHRGGSYDIYAQKIDSSGARQWTPVNGVVICDAVGTQKSCKIVPDGSDGAIITWRNDNADWNIYAQRVNSLGERQWSPLDGVLICIDDGPHSLWHYETVADGSGGAIIIWKDTEGAGVPGIIYAQKVNSSGTLLWGSSGEVVSDASEHAKNPGAVTDGSGGAIIVWWDERTGGDFDIYAQKIDSSGNRQWGLSDLCVCDVVNDQQKSKIASDDSGGAIIAWDDDVNGNGSFYKVYAQRVNSSGILEWDPNGVCICNEISVYPEIVADGSGGAIIVWQDYRSGSNLDIYAQKVNSSGISQWGANGICICNATGNQTNHKIIADGLGGTIITWDDERDGRRDIYAQRVDSNGSIHSGWTSNGVLICDTTGAGVFGIYPQIVTDGSGGAIITWEDSRNPANNGDIYAQRITADGNVGIEEKAVIRHWATGISVEVYPNPSSGKISIRYSMHDARYLMHDISLHIYDAVGRLIRDLSNNLASCILNHVSVVSWNGTDDYGHKLPAGIYFVRFKAGDLQAAEKILIVE